eukprot:5686101-Pyramimonas_sp.AAC.1
MIFAPAAIASKVHGPGVLHRLGRQVQLIRTRTIRGHLPVHAAWGADERRETEGDAEGGQ